MTAPAERIRIMRGLRELRLMVPDARSETIRDRVAAQVAGLSRDSELEALDWIEKVSEFDDAWARGLRTCWAGNSLPVRPHALDTSSSNIPSRLMPSNAATL
jgi:hypothetical protein